MATYGQLQADVQTNVIDTPSSVVGSVPQFINEAMKTLQRAHNFKVMEAITSLTTTLGARTLTLPSNFKEAREQPYVQRFEGDSYKLFWLPDRTEGVRLFGNSAEIDTGEPTMLLDAEPSDELGTRIWEVFPYPDGFSDYDDGEYRIVVPYWKFLNVLSASGDQNWFTINADEYLRRKATSMAFHMNWDEERGTYWETLAKEKFQEAINTDKKLRLAMVGSLPYYTGARGPHTGI